MKKLLWGLALVPVVLVLVVVLALFNLEPLINEYRGDIEHVAKDTLGRTVSFGPVETRWDGGPAVKFTDVKLAGPTAESPPTFSLGSAVLKVDLWKAVRSLGKQLEVRAFVLTEPSIRVTRAKDGTWDFQDILDRLKAGPPEEPAAEPAKEGGEDFKGVRIAGMAIRKARVEVDDQQSGRKLIVDEFDLAVSEIIPGKDVTAEIKFLIDDGKSRAPFALVADMRPLPADLDFAVPPPTTVKVSLGELDLAPWAALLPAGALRPEGGRVSFKLDATTTEGAEKADLGGYLEVKQLVLRQGKHRGQPADVRVDLDVHGNLKAQAFSVKRLDVTAPATTLKTRVEVQSPSVAGIRNADVELRVTDLARVIGVLPPGTVLLPAELGLEGPFEVDVKGDASAGNVRVDLDQAHLKWADVFDKRAGTPLNLKVTAKRAGDRITLPALALVVDTATLKGTADLSTKPGAPMNASLDTGPVVLASLRGILPPFQKALAGKGKVDGTFRLQATAKALGEQQALHAQLDLEGMDVVVDKATAKGGGHLLADVSPQGDDVSAVLKAELGALAVNVRDDKGAVLVNKAAGFPLALDVTANKRGQAADAKLDLVLGKTRVAGGGKATGLDQPSPTLDAGIDALDIAFDDVRALAPAASMLPQGGRLQARIKAKGNPQKLETVSVRVDDLKLLAAKNLVEGSAQVDDLVTPRFDVNLAKVSLNFDELRKLAKNDAIPPGGELRARITARGEVARLSTLDAAVEDLDTTVYRSRVRGHVRFKDVDRPKFDVKLEGDKLDISAILAALPKEEAGKKAKQEDEKPENPHGLPRATRQLLQRVTGKADVRVGRVTYEKHVLDDVVAVITVNQGDIVLDPLSLRTYDGTINASGTRIDADGEYLASHLKLQTRGVDLGKVINTNTTHKDAVDGKVDLEGNLTARGLTSDDILNSLAGPAKLRCRALTLNRSNLLAGIAGPIGKVASIAGKLSGKAADPKAPTTLKDIDADATFESGKMILSHPVAMNAPFGKLSLEGWVKFDSNLNLVGNTELNADAVAAMTGNKFKPQGGIKVPVRIGGTWHQPTVEGVDVNAFLQGAGIGNLAAAAKAAAEEAQRRMEEEAAKARQEADRLRQEAETRARAEAERLQQEATRRAETARKAAEEEARKRADEARRQAEALKKKAEDEARKKADEARKKAEDEARKRTDDAKKRAEDEARKKAEEAKKKAQEGLKNLFK